MRTPTVHDPWMFAAGAFFVGVFFPFDPAYIDTISDLAIAAPMEVAVRFLAGEQIWVRTWMGRLVMVALGASYMVISLFDPEPPGGWCSMTDDEEGETLESLVDKMLSQGPDAAMFLTLKDGGVERAVRYSSDYPAGGAPHLLGVAVLRLAEDAGEHPDDVIADISQVAIDNLNAPSSSAYYTEER